MGRKGNLTVFESSSISETRETMPTKIGVTCMWHQTEEVPTCMIFLRIFRSIKFFDDHGL